MRRNKSAKHSFILSVLSLLLCCSMLIGSTYAWFTSSVSTNVNSIVAGTLKVDLINKEGISVVGETLKFVDMDDNALWEPGCTYNLEPIRVKNIGNLALSYRIVVTGISGDVKLNEVIEWKVNGVAIKEWNSTGALLSEKISDDIVISGHMKNDAGNEYQGLIIDGIAITVYATQYSYENDSFGKDYDDFSKGYYASQAGRYNVEANNGSFGKVAILSDSLAAYPGTIPEDYVTWYSAVGEGIHNGNNTKNDVSSVADMWWHKLANETGSTMLLNESYAGTTIGNHWEYKGVVYPEYGEVTFVERMKKSLDGDGEQYDTIFILGGINDSSRNTPLGNLQFSDWTDEDLKCTIPSFCYILDRLRTNYPNARIINITVPRPQQAYKNIAKGMIEACIHYDVDCIVIDETITSSNWPGGHPNVAYMEIMKDQIIDFYK